MMVLLKNFALSHIGLEPSKNVHLVSKKGLNSVNKFFNKKNIQFLIKKMKFDLIYV